jgi:hypothetical protein
VVDRQLESQSRRPRVSAWDTVARIPSPGVREAPADGAIVRDAAGQRARPCCDQPGAARSPPARRADPSRNFKMEYYERTSEGVADVEPARAGPTNSSASCRTRAGARPGNSLALWERGEVSRGPLRVAAGCRAALGGAMPAPRRGRRAQNLRVVAELGRPETPDETAVPQGGVLASTGRARTRATCRRLLVTLAVVAVIIAVPEALLPRRPDDVAAVAQGSRRRGRTVLVPEVPRVAEPRLGRGRPFGMDDRLRSRRVPDSCGSRRIRRRPAWTTRVLSGAATGPSRSTAWSGLVAHSDPARAGNISAASALGR